MGRKAKYTKQIKIKYINKYNKGTKSLTEIVNELDCNKSTFIEWVKMYNEYGESVFDNKPTNSTYPKDFKEKVVKEYLDGKGSLRDIQVKYKILSTETLIDQDFKV